MAKKTSICVGVSSMAILSGLIVCGLLLVPDRTSAEDRAVAEFSTDGKLLRPEGYREWIFVGSPVTPHELNDGRSDFGQFRNVYVDRQSFNVYARSGKFPNGTVFVKEILSVGANTAPSGNGYFQGEYLAMLASVKSAAQFPNEPGNWAYFDFRYFPNLASSARAKPTADCNACHAATAAEDWVFTQHWPVLRAAKPD